MHAAALRLLARDGLRFGMEELAREAGVHKTTLYRRWPTLAELLGDVAAGLVGQDVRVPDSGSLEDDLRSIGRDIAALIGHPLRGPAMVALFTAPAGMTDVQTQIERFWTSRMSLMRPVVDRAIARGEVPEHTDVALVLEALAAPLYHRLFLTRRPIDDQVVERALRVTLPAARTGLLTHPAG